MLPFVGAVSELFSQEVDIRQLEVTPGESAAGFSRAEFFGAADSLGIEPYPGAFRKLELQYTPYF
jgi:hypothetical protein